MAIHDNSSMLSATVQIKKADVYTDLHGLQALKSNSDQDLALKQVAQQFESLFLNLMLKSMRDANAVFEEDSLFSSNESQFYRDMYDQQLSLSMAHNSSGGVGIADALYRQMSLREEETKVSGKLYGAQTDPMALTQHLESLALLRDQRLTNRSPISNGGKTSNTSSAERSAIASTPAEFIREVSPYMDEAAEQLGVEPEWLMAQSALETGWGRAVLADQRGSSFNLFNIKAGQSWSGPTVSVSSLEYNNGTITSEQSKFRRYESLGESVQDYVDFVKNSPRYASALDAVEDGEAYIRELQKSGYATDPSYADKVLSVQQRIIAQNIHDGSMGSGG